MKAKEERENLARIPDNEPVFILRGQDALATQVVQYWIILAEKAKVPMSKLTEAREALVDMHNWPSRRLPD